MPARKAAQKNTVQNDIDPKLLDEIEDSASEDEDEDEEMVPPEIEWDEDSNDSTAVVDEIVEEITQEQNKKESTKKGTRKSAVKSATPTKRTPKPHVCDSPPGEAIIVQCTIQFGTTLSENICNSIMGSTKQVELINDCSGARLCFNDWTPVSEILTEIESIRSICKREKVKIKGCVYVMYRENSNAIMSSGCIKVNSRHPVYTDCSIKITTVSEKKEESAKKFTDEEKMQLFKEYYDNNHKLPDKKEVYKEFKVGLFYESAMKNKNMVSQIDEIINEKE